MSTQRFESTWRKNVSSVCLRNEKSGCFGGHALISLDTTIVFRHWCSGPECRSYINGKPAIQHSRYSSSRVSKHKEQS